MTTDTATYTMFGAQWKSGEDVRPRDAVSWQVMKPATPQSGFPLGNGHYVSRTHRAALDTGNFHTSCGQVIKRSGAFARPDDGRPRNWCGRCYLTQYK